jgi:ATP/maltotriose-dependent transcriptional regulator MalT
MRWSLAMGLLLMSLHNYDAMAGPPDFEAAWDFGDPAGTERRLREMVPAVQAAGDADLTLQLQTQFARAEGLQQRFDEALTTLDAVDRSLTEATPIARLRATLERGRVHNSSGSPVTAVPLFEAAFEMAQKAKRDDLAVDAAHMVAIASGGDGGHRWNLKALALAEASSDPKAINRIGGLGC